MTIKKIFTFIFLLSLVNATESGSPVIRKIQDNTKPVLPHFVSVNGILGNAISNSEKGRLTSLPYWNNSELISIFSQESRKNNKTRDWYGEHAGKWLYTTALAVNRSGNKELKSLLLKTADILVNSQEIDGYLGTYSYEQRFTNNDISHHFSWDVWNLSYMVLGLLKVNQFFPDQKYSDAAEKTGELFLKTFGDGKNLITDYGTRKGLSATVILDPVIELYRLTKDKAYLNFARLILKEIEEKDGLKIISESLKGSDMENVGDGKAYQLIWNLTAITKLYRITSDTVYLEAVKKAWQNIKDHHLTVTGGPWGGIGKHYECFNRRGFWSPYGFVETCSIMAWIQLNRELLECCGDAKYAQEIERSAYNALLGAYYPNGQDWCYHSFPNGRRHAAHFNDCCPSSGALALEELSTIIYSEKENGLAINVYTESEVSVTLSDSNTVKLIQKTNYPFEGNIRITLFPSTISCFPVFLRIPEWAQDVSVKINNIPAEYKAEPGTYYSIKRKWKEKDNIEIVFPFKPVIMKKTENIRTPQGGPDISQISWFALTKGPLVYSTHGLIEDKDRERAFRFPEKSMENCFIPVSVPSGFNGPAYELRISGYPALIFLPYYEAGGTKPGTWRLTWIQDHITD